MTKDNVILIGKEYISGIRTQYANIQIKDGKIVGEGDINKYIEQEYEQFSDADIYNIAKKVCKQVYPEFFNKKVESTVADKYTFWEVTFTETYNPAEVAIFDGGISIEIRKKDGMILSIGK